MEQTTWRDGGLQGKLSPHSLSTPNSTLFAALPFHCQAEIRLTSLIPHNQTAKTKKVEKKGTRKMSPTSSAASGEVSIQEQVAACMEELQILGTLEKVIAASEHICIATPLGTGDFLADLRHAFRLNGIETCIKNALVLSRRRKNMKDEQEQLTYMRKAQTHFERRVSKALLNLQTDLKLSLLRQRSSSEAQELSSKWDELSTYDQDVGSIRNLYSTQDLYEAVVALRDPDYSINRSGDIQLTASRDEHYFVFEDLIYQVSLCFSRDSYVCLQLCSKFGSRAQTTSRFAHAPDISSSASGGSSGTGGRADGDASGQSSVTTSAFPPSSCIPFYGWAMYVAPLCYVYEEAEDIYYTLRAMYVKYWSRLHRLSSHGQGIVALSVLFERLLQQQEPELWIHCLNNNIEPLRIAMPWMVQAFSGFLIPEQLLFLWDLILGFDSMLLLPLLAASIFSLRRENLHRILSHDSAETIFSDLSTIQVVPLLQMALTQQSG
ncbi:hypothetical protein DAPPUDRAFT_245167 [Daphnia pulex]|uniref:Rab-GAP TBC domain-containing protein n=1 Tax=Daphnia pulex TaxID=6669 RepID=E9GMQ4_DAPPU|nr:hypothetical protein DAPPUDRAFT_245167 [Daphnia pulex]|eukprot:EFX79137.1 hypothetical protein DAPPUDRAFT_245167 [Daphnia pulex]